MSTEPATDDERELVRRFLRERDEPSFRALYARHAAVVLRVLRRVLGGAPGDVEDAFQETWRRCADRLEGFAFGSSLRTWLCGIALNCAREALRERGARLDVEEHELDRLPHAGEPEADLDVEPDRLEGAIARLAPGYRAVLVLHDVEGFTHEEIALQLGIRAGTSKSQLNRARAALRRALAPDRSFPRGLP